METPLTQRYHSLTVLSDLGTSGPPSYGHLWSCLCDCGNIKTVYRQSVLSGRTTSCGCVGRLNRIKANTKHDAARSVEYRTWQRMKQRCYNPNEKRFHRYGGRGIKVCPEWLNDFSQFLKDMGPRPENANSIDRINNDGDYSPTNCRWSNDIEQNRNTSHNHLLTLNGETKLLTDWATSLGIQPHALLDRFKKGWSLEEALTTPRVAGKRANRRRT